MSECEFGSPSIMSYQRYHRLVGINIKMTLLAAGMVFLSVTLLSSIVFWQYQSILLEKTFEVCRNLSVNISSAAREELLVDEIYDATTTSVANLFPDPGDREQNRISGLLNSYVINVDGLIVAHTHPEMVGNHPPRPYLKTFERITELHLSELYSGDDAVLQFAYPIFVDYRDRRLRVGTGVFEFDRAAIYAPIYTVRNTILLATAVLLLISILITYVLSRRLSRPVVDLVAATSRIAAGEFGTQVKIQSSDEIGQLADTFNKMSANLQEIQQLRIQQATMGREMEIARDIQLSLLPVNGDQGTYSFHGFMRSADDVGGDFYDCIRLKSRQKEYWWFLIGDVSGHGLPAGLITLMAQTAVHTLKELHPELRPEEAMAVINRVLYDNILRLGQRKYMTATLYRADAKGALSMAGLHLDTLIYRARTRTVDIIPSRGMWLGIEEDIRKDLKNTSFKLNKGDVLFLYTDGIIESRQANGNGLFEERPIVEILAKYGDRPLPELEGRIMERLAKFTRGATTLPLQWCARTKKRRVLENEALVNKH